MLLDNISGAFDSRGVEWPGGPGLAEATSVLNNQIVELQRLGGDGVTWVAVSEDVKFSGNAIGNFDVDRGAMLRLSQASGTNVFGDISTTRISP